MKRITHDTLVDLGACAKELAAFDREWPTGVSITRGNCLRAVELGLDMEWLARSVLTGDALKEYHVARDKARCEAYDTVSVYNAGREYTVAEAKAWEEYRKTLAIAFWRAVRGMESVCE